MMRKTKKVFAWIFYITVLAAVFLYLLFPAGAVSDYLEFQVQQATGNAVQVDIDQLRPGFPPALIFNGVRLGYRRTKALEMDRATVTPAYAKLLKNSRTVNFRADLGGGQARGWLRIEDNKNDPEGIALELKIEGVGLDSIHLIRSLSGQTISGSLEGAVDFEGGVPGRSGSGSAQLSANGCTVNFNPPVFGLQQVDFRQIQADLEIENQRINITRLQIDGSQFSGEGTGHVLVAQPIENSRIQMTASITPHPELLKTIGGLMPKKYLGEKGIPVRITGTLQRPSWTVR